MCDKQISMERRIALSMATEMLVKAREQYEEASAKFSSACEAIRAAIEEGEQYVVKIDFKYYLVSMDDDGEWDVIEVKTI